MTAVDGLQNALEEPEPRADSESKCEEIWALDQSIGHGNGEKGQSQRENQYQQQQKQTDNWVDQGMKAKS